MDNQPLVSVIIPCYNMERFITDTIHSVINQTYSDWELIVVDDVSTDRTVELVQAFCEDDRRIHCSVNPEHFGIAKTRNACIKQARGRFYAFLDADDLWHPEKLERQLKFMLEQQVGFCYSAYDLIDELGKSLGKTIKTAGVLDYDTYLRNTIIGCSTVMIDTEMIDQVVVPLFRTSEDTATWLDILKKGRKAYPIEEPLTSYRIREHSASSNKLKAASDLWKVYRQHEKLAFFKAVTCFICYALNAIKKRL
ncbi:MAG: glycosyltransferase [Bacteroidales bacterium]|nr:glycosyltransferase [Bacteroidales bacterium]